MAKVTIAVRCVHSVVTSRIGSIGMSTSDTSQTLPVKSVNVTA